MDAKGSWSVGYGRIEWSTVSKAMLAQRSELAAALEPARKIRMGHKPGGVMRLRIWLEPHDRKSAEPRMKELFEFLRDHFGIRRLSLDLISSTPAGRTLKAIGDIAR